MANERLHDLVRACRDGFLEAEDVYQRIACEVYRNPLRYGFDGEDDAAEALIRYKARIKNFVLRYTDQGVPFEAYLATSLRFLARSIRREGRRKREKELVCERSEGWAAESRRYAGSAQPFLLEACLDLPWAKEGRRPRGGEEEAFRTRLVFLYLKCAWDVDEEVTEKVAQAAEVPQDWLSAAAAQSLRSLEAERCRFERLCARRDRSWGRICLLEGRQRLELDPQARSDLVRSIRREQERLGRVRRELKAFRPTVSNAVVARILGVPKGTVDSGLYYLRRRLVEPVDL